MFDRRYAFDYYTNFIFSVDDIAADILTNNSAESDTERCENSSIEKKMNFINLLCDKGIISTEKKRYEAEQKKFQLSTISMFLTNNCNLRCKYCYEKNQHKISNMSEAVAKASIDFLLDMIDDNASPTISLFGGEPLLNTDLIEFIYNYIRKQKKANNYRFSITTNGTIMNDEIYSLLNKLGIKIMLSLDGSKEKQDANRKFENGVGSYDKIKSNIEQYLQSDLFNIVIRNTITKSDINYKDTYDFFKKIGFKNLISIPISTNDQIEKLSDDDISKLIANCKMIAEEVVNDIMGAEEILKANFFNFGQLYRKMGDTYCGAGIRSIAIDTNGDIYHCHRFVGDNNYKLGNIVEGVDKNDIINMQMEYYNRLNKLCDCKDCWAFNLCRGGCMHENLMEGNSINKTNHMLCNLRKAWYEISIALYAIICEMEPTLIEKIYGESLFNNYMNKWIPLNIS